MEACVQLHHLVHCCCFFYLNIAGTSSPVFLLPVPPSGSGPTMMIQPQPYILVNPSEFHKINATPLISTPNVLCGSSSNGFVLLSPSNLQSNSLHFVAAPGITGSHTGLFISVYQGVREVL